jgi:hypothetical protein
MTLDNPGQSSCAADTDLPVLPQGPACRYLSLHRLDNRETGIFFEETKMNASARHGYPKRPFAIGNFRCALELVMAAIVLCVLLVSPVSAKGGGQADPKGASAIDPNAMDALNKMGSYLRTLKAFKVKGDTTTDNVLDDGEVIQFSSVSEVVAAMPDRLRVEITDDDGHRFLFFDGKNFTIFGQVANFYATVPAPSTIGRLADDLSDKYGIDLPLTDLFRWGTNESSIGKIKAAADIGPSSVEGVTCEQYAFRQEGLDWQVWIALGEFPLPRKIVIRTLTDEARPQHMSILSWDLAPSFSENAFTFDPPPGALRIALAEVKAKAAEAKK